MVSKTVNSFRIGCTVIEKSWPERDPNVYAICCQLEVAGDVISCENVKTIESCAVLNFEVASFCSFWYIPENHFVTGADVDDSL